MCNKLILLSVVALAAVVGITHSQYYISPYGGGYSLGGFYGGGGGVGSFLRLIVMFVFILAIARLRDDDDDDMQRYQRSGIGDIRLENDVNVVVIVTPEPE